MNCIIWYVVLVVVTFFDLFDSRQLKGDIFSIFVIAIAVVEAAIGSAIVSSIHHNKKINSYQSIKFVE